MNEPVVGKLVEPENEFYRDAIHVAIMPVSCGDNVLNPGDSVTVKDGIAYRDEDNPVGIVDPFLKDKVRKFNRFILFLYPKTVTSLRHYWEHPAFPNNVEAAIVPNKTERDPIEESREYLDKIANNIDMSRNELIDVAIDYIARGTYFVDDGSESLRDYFCSNVHMPTFWKHIENVTKMDVGADDNETVPFSCSC